MHLGRMHLYWTPYLRFLESDSVPCMIPGHKGRAESPDKALAVAVSAGVPLHGGVDTIGLEAGVLAETERRAATLWNCDWCRLSSGGSTHGNQALALAVGRPGDKVRHVMTRLEASTLSCSG